MNINIETITGRLEKDIITLDQFIKTRNNNNDWLQTKRKGEIDTNEYFWLHKGEREIYLGRLEGLQQFLISVEVLKKSLDIINCKEKK